jgi:hypothetical protein
MGAMAAVEQGGTEQMGNPYIGPRTFKLTEWKLFFGRDQEARDLLALIISERLVLFYAPSGAGKSSLLNTKLIYGLSEEGFEVLPVARVGGESDLDTTADNIFTYNLITSVHRPEELSSNFEKMSLSHFLDNLVSADDEYYYDDQHVFAEDEEFKPRVLFIDQFEEILTTNRTFWEHRDDFFLQLNEAVSEDDLLWIVLAMREDYVAGLDPYLHHLPNRLRTRYFMQRLNQEAATKAIVEPANNAERPFEDDAAETLVTNLREIRLKENPEKIRYGEFVEPVQLQAVCYQMWKKLQADRPGDNITKQDVDDFADADAALIEFYEEAVADTVDKISVSESTLRSWFEEQLFTDAGTRNMVFRGKDTTGDLPTAVADYLHDRYLLRPVVRPGGVFYELAHGRLVEPIRQSNIEWREKRKARRRRITRPILVTVIVMMFLFGVAGIVIAAESRTKTIEPGSRGQGFVFPLLSDRWTFRGNSDQVVIITVNTDYSGLKPITNLHPLGKPNILRPYSIFLNRISNNLAQDDEHSDSLGVPTRNERYPAYKVDVLEGPDTESVYLLTANDEFVIDIGGEELSSGRYQLAIDTMPLEEAEYFPLLRGVCLGRIQARVSENSPRPADWITKVCRQAVKLNDEAGDADFSYQLCRELYGKRLMDPAPACASFEALAERIKHGETRSLNAKPELSVSNLLKFEAEEGQIAIISLNADDTIEPALYLLGPDLLRDERPRPITGGRMGTKDEIVALIPEQGSYWIDARNHSDISGAYEVSLELITRGELMGGDVEPTMVRDVCLAYTSSMRMEDTFWEEICRQAVQLAMAEEDVFLSYRLCGSLNRIELSEVAAPAREAICQQVEALAERIQPGEVKVVELGPKNSSFLKFEAEAGEFVIVSISADDKRYPYFSLLGPDFLNGHRSRSIARGSMDTGHDTVISKIPENGIYMIEARNQSEDPGIIEVSLNLETVSPVPLSVQPPQACEGNEGSVSFGPVDVGTIVRLRKHSPVDGEENWEERMEQFLWKEAMVLELSGVDSQGCPVVRVDIDKGKYQWRIRDFDIPGD